MAELAFLDAMRDLLLGATFTPPVPAGHIGALEPAAVGDLPALVLSLDASSRIRVGLGDRSDLMIGALPVRASIDLANPLLPGDPDRFPLVDPTRQNVTLPHGGLVRNDGVEAIAPLVSPDAQVRVDGVAVTLVPGVPAAGQAQIDPIAGLLLLGTPLPLVGTLDVDYFLGQWERRVERVSGVLRLDACAAAAAESGQIGADAVTRLLSPPAGAANPNVLSISLTSLSSVAAQVSPPAVVAHFRRSATFAFEFQRLVDRVESSGGVIRTIPVATGLEAETIDRLTGAILTSIVAADPP